LLAIAAAPIVAPARAGGTVVGGSRLVDGSGGYRATHSASRIPRAVGRTLAAT